MKALRNTLIVIGIATVVVAVVYRDEIAAYLFDDEPEPEPTLVDRIKGKLNRS